MTERCVKCGRGPEACEVCATLTHDRWEATCDCGLEACGAHMSDCESRVGLRFAVLANQPQETGS